ncbi:dynein associated protein-domain-containing protein [Pterulicium gracile]|uniref:Dynein associated protein-domain-containing protein n=1 Tax=Pterulicium gracile TaxID=1884261 RepID=A0A5C3QZT6_9AGAR|nr:dynein associated protein-domain-containing protein [Pterula gracilis]
MASDEPRLGSLVEISAGRGIVRFYGSTSFSQGKWVGIELFEPKGRNNGLVNGVTYFHCEPNYGVFVRPSQVKVIGTEQDRQPPPPTPSVIPSIQRAGHQRTNSITGRTRLDSIRAPATPTPSTSRSESPAKHHASPSPVPRQTLASPTKRTPPTALQPPRKNLLRRESGPNFEPPPSPARARAPSPLPAKEPTPRSPSPELVEVEAPQQTDTAKTVKDDRELVELRAKVRILESQRADDAQHIREIKTRLTEAESFVSLRPKLQAKLASLQTELTATKRELADLQQLSDISENKNLDSLEQLEMAMLDKEVAEEKAEMAEAEVEDLKERLAIAEVELDVLKSSEDAEEEDQVRSSLAYIQLEKQNERLREALLKLRDVTQENDQDHRKRITEMEKDVLDIEELRSSYDSTVIKLNNADVQIEDLKLQLDVALGAEDMIVDLTEQNLELKDKIEEMRIMVEDLEALKELSDELEENHVETEKALLEDLESKDAQMREQVRKTERLEEVSRDLEATITQFRDLVYQLQGELDSLRNETQTAQQESANAASRNVDMISLNVKLQSSVTKSQARIIEHELKRLEARELRELLGIIQPYLPQQYLETDSDASSCYLFFERIGAKADIINTAIAHKHGLPDCLDGPVTEALMGACELRQSVSIVSTFCKRFAAVLRKCDAETYLAVGRLYPELAPLEKRIDMHIEFLCKDEFREVECFSDVEKLHGHFKHLAQQYFDSFHFDLAEREIGCLLSLDNDVDFFAAAIALSKTSIETVVADSDVTVESNDEDIQESLLQPLQSLLTQSKSIKALSRKLLKRVEDLLQESSAVKAETLSSMEAFSRSVSNLTNFGVNLAQQILPHVAKARSSQDPFVVDIVLNHVKQTLLSTLAQELKEEETSWGFIKHCLRQLLQDGTRLLSEISEKEAVVRITSTAPWIARTAEIKAAAAYNAEAERKAAQLADEIQGLVRTLKERDQGIQESAVKIQLMDRRLEASKKQGDSIVELEGQLGKAREQERAYEEAMEQLQADLQTLEQEHARLKANPAGHERQTSNVQVPEADAIAVEGTMETSYLIEQVEALRGTVRFLRTENSFLKGQDLLREIHALPPLKLPVERPATPPLHPSGLSDTDESDEEAPVTLLSLSAETKVLYRDVMKFATNPKIVDLSQRNERRHAANGGGFWMRKKHMPAQQVLDRKTEAERLSRRVKGLLDRAKVI